MTWHAAVSADELREGEVLGLALGGLPVALYRLDGEVFATHDICTHAHACMSEGYLEDGVIECPLHQARFDVRTGRVLSGPTRVPLATYPARTEGGQVLVDLPAAPAAA
jgi:nitrite reductase/ring-hydroxylating ferredoxin subunit